MVVQELTKKPPCFLLLINGQVVNSLSYVSTFLFTGQRRRDAFIHTRAHSRAFPMAGSLINRALLVAALDSMSRTRSIETCPVFACFCLSRLSSSLHGCTVGGSSLFLHLRPSRVGCFSRCKEIGKIQSFGVSAGLFQKSFFGPPDSLQLISLDRPLSVPGGIGCHI